MKFYNREKEIDYFNIINKKANKSGQMTFVVGRRRIGKTSLLINATKKFKTLYFFLTKKSEALLCKEFQEEIKDVLNVEIYGELKTFKDIFGFLMDLSAKQKFTLIIDEFQEFSLINPSVYSEMQNIWDSKKNKSKINLILCGSIYSLMKKIFENTKEPLFGRATNKLHLKAFTIKTLKEILKDYNPNYSNEDLLTFYIVTGGVAKYVEMLVNEEAFTKNDIIDTVFKEHSLFIDEGKNVLIEEFGRDYGTYFSILSLIASSRTARTEIESILEMNIGGFLNRLENDFGIIEKIKPIFSKPNGRTVKYKIKDNFLNLWFRFIYKYRSAIEIGNFDYVKNIFNRDYSTFAGKLLEQYFIDKFTQENNLSEIGCYWERGNKNEIDIVTINSTKNKLCFYEVKLNKEKINLDLLNYKSYLIANKYNHYNISHKGLSVEDM